LFDGAPLLHEVGEIAHEIARTLPLSHRADDNADALRDIELLRIFRRRCRSFGSSILREMPLRSL
jgi:hypothetical protein